ncbi:hypothetical protein M9H77_03419 [Catharanthus roseus]|uniref:Uncharacterized protein n=1 Tax=Catharanthus roseus TaxID=4058 RepID=A0ACC0CB81_CATRO|nr:hypothetical protein M9H77_03419 [Catharanthus roseus]
MAVRWRLKRPKAHIVLLFCTIFLSWFSAFTSAAVVTLESIEIFRTHEWLNFEPSVYFQCKVENRTFLPDVKEKHVLYSFKGEESWQPLTDLTNKKCKRCGFYEKDSLKSDDVFDEWEFCASDFTRSDGKYVRTVDKEFNATFFCLDCISLQNASSHSSSSQDGKKQQIQWILVGLISGLALIVTFVGAIIAYKYWQRRKKQQEQARFLRLFEDNDDIEDELGIGPLSHVI